MTLHYSADVKTWLEMRDGVKIAVWSAGPGEVTLYGYPYPYAPDYAVLATNIGGAKYYRLIWLTNGIKGERVAYE